MTDRRKPVNKEQLLKRNLEDDVRAFLLRRLPWNLMADDQRNRVRTMGADPKRFRRPTFIYVAATDEASVSMMSNNQCNIGAEGVMAHAAQKFVHLAFKCGVPDHQFHYSTFEIDTVVAMARAVEATWPGSVSSAIAADAETDEDEEDTLTYLEELDEEDEDEEEEEEEEEDEDDFYI